MAIDNNEDGYDVLSVVAATDVRPLSIEVKGSTMGIAGTFHLSRNEWERAIEAESHLFDLWDMGKDREPALAVITPEDLKPHIPVNQGTGIWESVKVPFAPFIEQFEKVTALFL
ncbi:MAG TPA: DUF3883 domain-containing protein [Terriglobales bacterium]|nr:DUF3883 domain-containing protein [Terriglobales bacterium]